MTDDVKVLRDSLAMLAGDMPYNPDTIIASDIIVRRRLADSIEREEAEFSFTHEQINERDRVIAEQAWNAALEAAEKAVRACADKHYGTQTQNELCAPIRALRRGPAS